MYHTEVEDLKYMEVEEAQTIVGISSTPTINLAIIHIKNPLIIKVKRSHNKHKYLNLTMRATHLGIMLNNKIKIKIFKITKTI